MYMEDVYMHLMPTKCAVACTQFAIHFAAFLSLSVFIVYTYILHAAPRPEKAVAGQLPCPLKVVEVVKLLLPKGANSGR